MSVETPRRRCGEAGTLDGVVVAFVYLCAQGLMFLNKGIYWDDWVWYRQPWGVLTGVSRQLGSMWPAWTFAAPYQSGTSVWVARAVAATCYLLASVWFLGILRRLGIDRNTSLVMALCFAVFPVNGARIPIATAAYGVSLALFVGGFRLVIASFERSSVWLRVAAAAALLLSLRTASFGVLMPLVLGYVVWAEGAARDPRRWPSVAVRHAELLLVPVVYVALRVLVLVPSGMYGEYNTITSQSASKGLRLIPLALSNSLAAPLRLGLGYLIGVSGILAALVVLAAVVLAGFFSRRREEEEVMLRPAALLWTSAGLALTVVGLLPYLLVGKMPALDDFSSRHQLLVPFGVAIAFGGVLRLVFGRSRHGALAMLVVASLLLGGFVAADATNNVSYLRERYKDVALMEAMRVAPEFQAATTFTFDDRTSRFNANRRHWIRTYEYAGMMAETFGDQTRFGAAADEFATKGLRRFRFQFTSIYKMGAYVGRPVQYEVEVLPGPLGLDRVSTVMRLLEVDLLDPSALGSATAGAIKLVSHGVGANADNAIGMAAANR